MDERKNRTPWAPEPAAGRGDAGQAAKSPAKGAAAKDAAKAKPAEIGGPKGPEPTRSGDWERGGICVDF